MARKGKKRIKVRKQLMADILAIFKNSPKKALNYKQVSRSLGISHDMEKVLVEQSLIRLENKGDLEELEKGKYKLKSHHGYITGTVELTQSGSGFVITDELDQDVFISPRNLHHSLTGDVVKVYLYAQSKRKGKIEGEIVEIIKPIDKTYVASLEVSEQYAFAIVDDKKMPYDIFIPKSKLNGAKDGQLVGVKVTEWPRRAKNPFGSVNLVFGDRGNNEAEIHAILAEFELPYRFPEKVLKAADAISDEITKEEIAKRRDMRDIVTFTIDPVDAKDFDDALSIKKLDNGNWEIGVHIADVSHYVQPNTILDNEAYSRATSVYLVDRTVPMLPERISNGICSLRPDEEKLCYSAVFELDNNAAIINEWFGRTVIKSDRRFTYEEAQLVIETEEGDFTEEILLLDTLAKKMRNQRFNKGAIAFDKTEVKFNLGEQGEPLSVFFKVSKDANKLIEEFMLLANKRVAEFVTKMGNKAFVYRIHDKPNEDKMTNFAQFVKKLGYKINLSSNRDASKSINELLAQIKGKKIAEVIETVAVRAMAKAAYSTKNIGHYGLAFDDYSHFTSPIRRYPDVMVHRLLTRYLDKKDSANPDAYEDKCKHSSKMEQIASNAERASIKFKQVEFMQDKVGEEFDGLVSGVAEWGIYVEIIENRCEGLVSVKSMEDDIYIYDEQNYCLKGKHSKQVYRIGDKVRIKIIKTNLAKKQMDFSLVSEA